MKRFLLLALTAGLISPIAARADDFKVRDTCGRLARYEITGKEAFKRLKLKKTFKTGERIAVNDEDTLFNRTWLFNTDRFT